MSSKFSQRLKELREERELTMQKLGEEIGTSGVSIGYYERGERVPDIHTLANMCKFFGVTSDYLIGLEDCRTHEAADIHSMIGLNEESIAILLSAKSKLENTNRVSDRLIFDTLDFLLQDTRSLDCIYCFLVGVSPWGHSAGRFYRLMEDTYNFEEGTWSENNASKNEQGKKLIDAMNSYLVQNALLELRGILFDKYRKQAHAHADEE